MSKRGKTKRRPSRKTVTICIVAVALLSILAYFGEKREAPISLEEIPPYSGEPYVEIQNGVPFFEESDWTTDSFETYSELDALGRCAVAYANICPELMPTEPRGSIGSVKPSGWHTIRYNGLVEGNYLYNRCHLIGYQLAGENANPKNLITGTRYLNTIGMLPFENMVDDYVEETGNHVLYRVTPMFEGENLVASGVLMEAYSVEDSGAGLQFCVYCYNVQPGIEIDYVTGESWLSGEETRTPQTDADVMPEESPEQPQDAVEEIPESIPEETVDKSKDQHESVAEEKRDNPSDDTKQAETEQQTQTEQEDIVYLTKTGSKYHRKSCRHIQDDAMQCSRAEAVRNGYEPCGICHP